jgi:RNA polymerase sigma-70 factor (ECF subfamily)
VGTFQGLAPTLSADRKMTGESKKEFQKFWNQSSGRIRAYMFCMCRSWADADDMTQDCFLRAFKAWEQFDGKAGRQAWIWGIAKRTRVDWYRKKQRDTALSRKHQDEYNNVDSSQHDSGDIDKVWDVIKKLSDERGEVIHLRFTAGLSYIQIAETLGVPVGTVRSRLHRSLKDIRNRIGDNKNGT